MTELQVFTKLVPSQTTSRSTQRRCSVKKDILKHLQNFTCVRVCFKLYEKETPNRCFPVKFAKILRTPIPKNICERLFPPFLGFTKLNRNALL